jgi:hypothetical protein
LDLTLLGAEVQEWAEQDQSREEEEDEEVHKATLKGASHIPALFEVKVCDQGNDNQVEST